ncbi:hypothetical protein PoHVEF18_002545 [Penicillium ochrochloron]
MGLQDYYYVSAFSQSSALAMTWDKEAFCAQAKAVATEFYLKGIQVVNGPTSQPLGRTPWGGRLVETFGSDPHWNGIATGLSSKAYKDAGVIAGAKHFILNEQETNRTSSGGGGGGAGGGPSLSSSSNSSTSASMGSSISSATAARLSSSGVSGMGSMSAGLSSLCETYLWSFYDAVHSGLGGVMCAMTQVNNTLSCESSSLLMKLLKTELGFPGFVFPDTNAQQHALASATNGLDYGSASLWTTSTIEGYLKTHNLTEARLNDMAIRNLIGYYYVKLDNGTQPSTAEEDAYVDVRSNHAKLIRSHGAKSMILLNKADNALPLNKPRKMAIFGSQARAAIAGPNMAFSVEGLGPTYDGHLATDSGSGQGSLPYLITPETALTIKASQDDVCLVFLNALAGEGADRTELYNDDQDTLVNEVADNCENTIVVINTVGARLMDQWIEHDNVTAVLYGSLLGQESRNSIVDVLYGDVNPSGRLIYTIAKNESDYNVGICYNYNCTFTEGNYIDYRYFDAYNVTPRNEGGYRLSYTQT